MCMCVCVLACVRGVHVRVCVCVCVHACFLLHLFSRYLLATPPRFASRPRFSLLPQALTDEAAASILSAAGDVCVCVCVCVCCVCVCECVCVRVCVRARMLVFNLCHDDVCLCLCVCVSRCVPVFRWFVGAHPRSPRFFFCLFIRLS